MRDKILKILKENKEFLKKQYGITKLGLFGSVARDEKNPNDIDILFDFNNSSFKLQIKTEKTRKNRTRYCDKFTDACCCKN